MDTKNYYEEYDWFLRELDEMGGVMDTSYATLNYLSIEELTELEKQGIIVRMVPNEDFMKSAVSDGLVDFDNAVQTDTIYTQEAARDLGLITA